MEKLKENPAIEQSLEKLVSTKDDWVKLSVGKKIEILKEILLNLKSYADEWVEQEIINQKLDPVSNIVGEEWGGSIQALGSLLNGYIETLELINKGKLPDLKYSSKSTDQQLVIDIFPRDLMDSVIMKGITAEIWMQPGITMDNMKDHIANFYKQKSPSGKVVFILGAGNVNSIPFGDALYKLFVEGKVAIMKMNPVNEYIGPVMEKVLDPLIREGYLKIIYGGIETGQYVVNHSSVDEIHITGSLLSYENILYGEGEAGKKRKADKQPLLKKNITSELGGVSPFIVVPGDWSERELQYQAENVVSAKFYRNGAVCVAAQVLVLPENWKLKEAFMEKVKETIKKIPTRKVFYRGSKERQEIAVQAHPEAEMYQGDVPYTVIENVDYKNIDDVCFNTEFFAPVLCSTQIPGETTESYIRNAVEFCNDTLLGTLGCTLVAHPKTLKQYKKEIDQAIADLKYGSIGINIWNAVAFLLPNGTWGAYPVNDVTEVASGLGVVHNVYLLEGTQKTVGYGPFVQSPKPPWFATNKNSRKINKIFAHYSIDEKKSRLPGLFYQAFKG